MKKNIYLFIIFGTISGFLSSFFFISSLNEHQKFAQIFGYGPGIVFGVTISLLLFLLLRKNILFHILYVGISIGAYYAALSSYFYFSSPYSFLGWSENTDRGLALAGLVGSLILAVGLRLLYPIRFKYIPIIIGLGTILGLPMEQLGIFYFPLWQAVVATAIGYTISKSGYSRHK